MHEGTTIVFTMTIFSSIEKIKKILNEPFCTILSRDDYDKTDVLFHDV